MPSESAPDPRDVMPVEAGSPDHPLRGHLHGEVHARPSNPLSPPERLSHIIMLSDEESVAEDRACLARLCACFGITPPLDGNYFYHDFGPFRLKWERHTEFCAYTFFHHGSFPRPFEETVVNMVPQDWLQGLPGKRLVAVHIAVLRADAPIPSAQELARHIGSPNLVGSTVSAGAQVWTDFHLHKDGFGRILVHDQGLTPGQLGRLAQRLLEIETYRMMALLAFPLAREAGRKITKIDQALAEIMGKIEGGDGLRNERDLLMRLTQFAVESERIVAETSYRFSAAFAYYDLVLNRLEKLREDRIEGLQTISEFLDRRLTPAMRTCELVAARQVALSQRIIRASNLLRTRVDIVLEGQNRDLLASMNHRARLQLRLQQTVEGLSVAAISYYVVGLIGIILEAMRDSGLVFNLPLARGVSIPVVVVLVWLAVRRLRRALLQPSRDDPGAR